MKQLTAKIPTRLVLLLVVGVAAVSISACGRTTLHGVTQDQLSAGAEPYFNVGSVTYQIQISRQLNPFDNEDVQYFAGALAGSRSEGDRQPGDREAGEWQRGHSPRARLTVQPDSDPSHS